MRVGGTGVSSIAALQRPAATRADRQAMFLPVIDPRRRRAMIAGVAVLRTGTFVAPSASGHDVRLRVDRPHARRRAGRNPGRRRLGLCFQPRELRVLFCDAACGGEQREGDGVGSERVQPASAGLIADPGLQGGHEFVEGFRSVSRIGTRRRAAQGQDIRACALPAQGLNRKNLKKSC